MTIFFRHFFKLLFATAILGLAACDREKVGNNTAEPQVGQITTDRLININSEPGSWLTGGRGYKQQYYSPLNIINKNNIQQLGFAWQYEIETEDGFEATPIVVDGTLFTSGPKGTVYAVDAKTGDERWHFEPNIDSSVLRNLCCGIVNRGVAVWQGTVFVGSVDGYLYALNAEDGTTLWKVDTITERDRVRTQCKINCCLKF